MTQEILDNHLNVVSSNRGGVFFSGKTDKVINFCISSKFASRINLQLLQEKAEHYEDLYAKAKKINWEKWITEDLSFRIDAQTKDSLHNSQFATHKLKDAILDALREKKVPLPDIQKRVSDITIVLRSFLDKFSIELSLTGESLGRRGYRLESGAAPVREPIAQAMLEISEWKPGSTIVDPMCGSGTILIEAALREKLLGEINKFILAESPIFTGLFPDYVFSEAQKQKPKTPHFFGFDIDPEAIRIAKENAYEAGVEDWIQFDTGDVLNIQNRFGENGHIITNPPYGDRLGKPIENLREMYFQMGRVFKNEFPGWKLTVLCGEFSLLGKLAMKEKNHLPLRHANLKAKIVDYQIKGKEQTLKQ
ncbi:class I SAM-dependent RNA methyltransferase [Leptospira idonii]|uniref:Class I SAM-dependent RNA methyltransferase n=1 Tax=Leptospira idonii TaxID=1193500 RepID=A0A4R9M1N2_9LEPT|nr:class I SAM-dependent RNA methyltransferase [Leptospira idonii]TGN18648.1 class I SAM-dependent RNA methyltransferase [Leptospira idonii]